MSRFYRPFAYDSDGPSMGEEWWAEHQFEYDFPHGVNNDEWTTRDGRTLKITEMTSDHIRNCMKMLERDAEEDEEGNIDDFYFVLEAELERRRKDAERILQERQRIVIPEEVPF